MICVLIVCDTRLYRDGLALLLGRQEGIRVVELAASSNDSRTFPCEVHPDIVLVQMGQAESAATLRSIKEYPGSVKVVAVGVSTEDEVIACAEAGVSGYLPRDGSLEDLVNVIQAAVRGEAHCSPRIAATLLKRVATLAAERGSHPVAVHLTHREREVLKLIDRGLSNKEIASLLTIEVRTVKNHVHSILEKLRVHSRGLAAALMRESALSNRTMTPL